MWGHLSSQAETEPAVLPPTSATPHHLSLPGSSLALQRTFTSSLLSRRVPVKVPQVDSILTPEPSCHGGQSFPFDHRGHQTHPFHRVGEGSLRFRLQPSNSKFSSDSTQKVSASAPSPGPAHREVLTASFLPGLRSFQGVSFCRSPPPHAPPATPESLLLGTFIGHRCRALRLPSLGRLWASAPISS